MDGRCHVWDAFCLPSNMCSRCSYQRASPAWPLAPSRTVSRTTAADLAYTRVRPPSPAELPNPSHGNRPAAFERAPLRVHRVNESAHELAPDGLFSSGPDDGETIVE